MIDAELKTKRDRLAAILEGLDSLVVAFSGGVDSTLLLAMAREALGDRVLAVTAESPIHPRAETGSARNLARGLGVRHILFRSGEMAQPDFLANLKGRCYLCKKSMLTEVFKIARENNIPHVAHGANLDDLDDFRPGFKAAEEMGVLAPLMDAAFTKADVRALSRAMNLETWNKPAMACLASRVPYETVITSEILAMVERGEIVLMDLGFTACRLRHHGPVARIEAPPDDIPGMLDAPLREKIVRRLRAIGYLHVSLDLEGYVQGSLNRAESLGS